MNSRGRADLPRQLEAICKSPRQFELSSVQVLENGELQCTAPRRLAFAFEYFGLLFHGAVEGGAGPKLMRLAADLGPLPFTSRRPAVRQAIQTVIAAANRLDGARLEVTPAQEIALTGAVPVDQPVTASALLVAATEFVLSVKPVLDLLAHLLAAAESERAAASRD